MLTLIGLLTICSLVVLLLIGRMSPVLPLIVVPLLGALAASFGPEAISGFFTDGIGRVTAIATMFVFAITFFGVLQDTGLFRPLIGGYPAVYGLVGAFTFLLWSRLGAVHANRMRAFTLIGMLLAFQLVFGIVFGGAGYGWIAEIAGFGAGFLLSFVLVDGGVQRVLRQIRAR